LDRVISNAAINRFSGGSADADTDSGGSTIDPESLRSPTEVAPALLTVLEGISPSASGSWVGVDGTPVVQNH
jgi:hypothetical protein